MQKSSINMDDLYQEILVHQKKSKTCLKIFDVCNLLILLAILNPTFLGMIAPISKFGAKGIYHLYIPLFLLKNYCINTKEYLQLERSYFLLLKELKDLLIDIEIEKPMEIFSIYHYLVLNGFLSVDKKFYAENVDLNYHEATSIVTGYGVCRHLAPFLTDLLKYFDYDTFNIGMFLNEQRIVRMNDDNFNHIIKTEDYKIDDSIESNHSFLIDLIMESVRDRSPNHCATLLADGSKSYIMDPMNNTIYFILYNRAFPIYNFHEPVDIKWKGDLKTQKTNISSSEIEDLNQMLREYDVIRKKCPSYSDTFEKFYLEHRELYCEIIEKRNNFENEYQKIKQVIFQK